jgi:hypothetical protein
MTPNRAHRARDWMRTHPGMVVLLAIPVVVFGLPQLFGWSFLDGDNFLQNFPMRVLVGRDLRHGMLPLWNPYLFSGTPLLAGFNAGAAYPTTWLWAVLPIFTAWWLNLALAYDLAIAGMYLFLRRQSIGSTAATFGAATFACAGYMTAQLVHFDLISGAAWLPWMLIAVHGLTERREPDPPGQPGSGGRRTRGYVALLAVSLGLIILSGGAEAIIDSGVLVTIYWVGRLLTTGLLDRARRPALLGSVAAVVGGVAGGVALGAAQWLPGLAFTDQSQRAATTYSFFTSGSLPARLVTLVASPFVLGTSQGQPGTYAGPYNFQEVTSYVGILSLIAACSLFLRRYRRSPEARHWWIWYVIMAVGLLSALGGETPFGHLMYLIPGVSDERLLNRNLLLVDCSLAVLAAWWVHLLLAGRSEPGAQATRTVRQRWNRGQRAEIVVTCVPLFVIAALCLFLWVGGHQLDRLLDSQVPVGTVTRVKVAGLVTAGTVVAAAATWIVLVADRFPTTRLRRLLAVVLAVDLVLFNCFVIRPPLTEATAQAAGTLASSFRTQVGGGRFIIYDPDEFETDQLYALGQTDLNIHGRLPSGQGYTALTDGQYYDATGAHYQEDLDPSDLAGPVWDQLNVTTLLSLPGYFVTPVASSAGGDGSIRFPSPIAGTQFPPPPLPGSFTLGGGRSRHWYFGGVLTVRSVTVPVPRGVAAALRIGLVTTTGGTRWLAPADIGVVGADGHRSDQVTLPSGVRAGGLVVEARGPAGSTVGTPTARTVEAGEVALDGRMQYGVVPPHWVFTGTLGSFGVFHNDRVRGWAWVRAPGGGTAPGGSSVTAAAPDQDGGQQIAVHAASAVVLERSESWSPGWRATLRTLPAGPHRAATGPSRPATVVRSGVIQQVALPGPGDYLVTFSYAAASAVAGLVVSAAAVAGLVVWALVEVSLGRRRRRRARVAPGGLSPE